MCNVFVKFVYDEKVSGRAQLLSFLSKLIICCPERAEPLCTNLWHQFTDLKDTVKDVIYFKKMYVEFGILV